MYLSITMLRSWRRFAGLTQAEAARLVGVSTRQWQRFEAGRARLRPEVASKIGESESWKELWALKASEAKSRELAFVRQATAYIRETGKPYLPQLDPTPRKILLAVPHYDDEYRLFDAAWRPAPHPTWRDILEEFGEDDFWDAVSAVVDIEGDEWPPDEWPPIEQASRFVDLDAPVPVNSYACERYHAVHGTPESWAYYWFETFPCSAEGEWIHAVTFSEEFYDESGNLAGRIAWYDGPFPGSDYQGVGVTSTLALSILHYRLYACGTGAHIEWAEEYVYPG